MNLFKLFSKKQGVYAGLDISSAQGISSFVMIAPETQGIRIMSRFWIPADVLISGQCSELPAWKEYVDRGYIQTTTGNVVDYAQIGEQIRQEKKKYNIRTVAFDRWGSEQMAGILNQLGLKVALVGQGFASLSVSTKEFERLQKSEKILSDNPVFPWMVNNLVIQRDAAGNAKPNRLESKGSVGGVVAAIMAIGLLK